MPEKQVYGRFAISAVEYLPSTCIHYHQYMILILVALLYTLHTEFLPPCMPWLWLLGLLGRLRVMTGPLKVAKFRQGFSSVQTVQP